MTSRGQNDDVSHPLFARFYTRFAKSESQERRKNRGLLVSGLSGRVLELGAGTGANLPFYPPEVSEVLAVEPEPRLRGELQTAAENAGVAVTVVDGTADQLPAEDGSCDAAVACLVLCSVPDQLTALRELQRVLRPGGELRFYEHVLSYKPSIARSQRFVDRLFWPRVFGNCHTARDTPAAIAQAGFDIKHQHRLWEPPCPGVVPAATHVIGKATRQ